MKTKSRSPLSELFILLALSALSLLLIHNVKTVPEGRWIEEDGAIYYEDRHGDTVTGWQAIDGVQYYFGTDGTLTTGWLTLNDARYYFDADGSMVTLWKDIDGKRYYFTPGGTAVSGWQGIDGQRYYFHPDNTLATGLTEIDGKQYLFSGDGTIFTGFVQLDGKKYLFLSDGTMAYGWAEYQGSRYFAQEDGTLYTGWYQEGEYRYYFHPDGVMAVGETFVDGVQLYFSPRGVQITLVNPWHYIPKNYQVNLVAIDEDYSIDASCYDALMRMLADCEAAGLEPMICSAYRSQAAQEWLYERKVNFYLEEGLEEDKAKQLAGRSVAVPGTSEHQLGLAVDIVSTDYYVLDDSQATTKTQQWLMEHCWEYGFILRYPDDKSEITGIIYEPWHYRYVGVEVAMDLRDLGITLEEYLGAVTY